LNNTHGIGINKIVTNPKRDVAHGMLRRVYTATVQRHSYSCTLTSKTSLDLLCSVKRGNAAPRIYLNNPFAAIADAPLSAWYVSTRYIPDAMKMQRFPHANGIAARTGEAQEISDRVVHANQKSPVAICSH
jgi:hypothetical protein